MRVIICASPQWNYNRYVEDEIVKLLKQSKREGNHLLILHGAKTRTETEAQEICNARGIDQVIYSANRSYSDSA